MLFSQLLYRILGLEDAFIPELRRIEPIPSMSEANLARLQRRRQAMEEERRAAKMTKPGDQQHNNEYAVSRVYFNLQHSSSSNLLNGWLWKFFGCGVGGTAVLYWDENRASLANKSISYSNWLRDLVKKVLSLSCSEYMNARLNPMTISDDLWDALSHLNQDNPSTWKNHRKYFFPKCT